MSLSKNEIKFLKALQQKKFREQEQLFVVEGIKLVKELLRSEFFEIEHLYHLPEFLNEIPTGVMRTEIGQKDLERISGLKTPNQVLATVKYNTDLPIDMSGGTTLILDEISDPGNLGTIIRTAEWFGATQVICTKNSVDKYNPKVVQASMGSIFRMPVHYADLSQLIEDFKQNDFQLLGADMEGANAFEMDYKPNCVLIMGPESHGISEETKSKVDCITIPRKGNAESLNVAMATGILLAEICK